MRAFVAYQCAIAFAIRLTSCYVPDTANLVLHYKDTKINMLKSSLLQNKLNNAFGITCPEGMPSA
jgi:hypothetical protein